jgi:hypothetical protein
LETQDDFMGHQYYFVGTSLPPLKIGEQPDISWDALQRLLKDNLSSRDYEQTRVLRRYFDILNIRAFLKKEPLDAFGNLDKNDLEEALLGKTGFFPSYVMSYLDRHESKEDRIFHFPELIAAFFREEVDDNHGFLKQYLEFERNLRLIITAYRAKQLGRDITKELQFENPDENLIVQLLSQKDSKNFEPPAGYEDLKLILDENYSSPLALQKALSEFRFKKMDEMSGFNVFSFDRILAYLASFFITEKWVALDKEQGLQIIENIIKPKG